MKMLTFAVKGENEREELEHVINMIKHANSRNDFDYFAGTHKTKKGPHVHMAIKAEKELKIPDGLSFLGMSEVGSDIEKIERYIKESGAMIIKSRHWPAENQSSLSS